MAKDLMIHLTGYTACTTGGLLVEAHRLEHQRQFSVLKLTLMLALKSVLPLPSLQKKIFTNRHTRIQISRLSFVPLYALMRSV